MIEIYEKVIFNLKGGYPVYKTLAQLDICSGTFYKSLTLKQKVEIKEIRALLPKAKHHSAVNDTRYRNRHDTANYNLYDN